jgi:hypothetical protein
MLRNEKEAACITIQCYTYAESDTTHHPYFDYIEESGIGYFTPNSDMDYVEFRDLMRQEWESPLLPA